MGDLVHESAFDFNELIETALVGYLARPVVERTILDCFSNHRAGCCVIVGEPGSGKTALAASLIKSGGYAHHFLRASHTEFTLWRDPYAFLTSIGFQLKGLFGDSIFPEAVGMDVRGQVRDVAEGGSVVGAEIQQLVTVPWHSANVRVKVEAAGIKGTAVGVRIQQVVEDYRRIPLGTFREMALIDPLRRLTKLQPDARVVLWIDGLDEIVDQLPGEDRVETAASLAGVLPLTNELLQIGNLFLVISSRPSVVLDRFLENGAHKIELSDARFAEDNAGVVERYIDREVAIDEVQKEITKSGKSPAEIKQTLVTACSHNLLYLRQFFVAVRDGDLPNLIAGGLPKGLDSIYARLLARIARQAGDRYLTEFHPLVSVLAVAGRGLTTEQIKSFTGLDRNRVNAAIAQLRPFLDVERIQARNTHGFYHRSFRDCLGRPEHQDEVWYVEPEGAHDDVAQYYLSHFEAAWPKMDDYGFAFLVHHLAHGGEEHRQRLFGLMGENWRRAKRQRHGTNRPFSEDLAVAARCAGARPFPEALLVTAKLALMDTLVADLVGQLPTGALELMVRLGQVQRAFDYIRPDKNAGRTINLLVEMIRGFSAVGEAGRGHLYRLLEQGIELASRYPDQAHGLLERLLENVPASAEGPMPELLQRAIQIFNSGRAYWSTPTALAELGRLLAVVNREEAGQTFRQALDACEKYSRSSRSIALEHLLRLWANFDAAGAAELLSQVPLERNYYGIRAASTVLRTVEHSGTTDVVRKNRDILTQKLVPGIENPFEYARALTEVAGVELELGNSAEAAAAVTEALAAIAKIGGADDPERTLQNRPNQATTAIIHAAAIDIQIDPVRGRETLAKAWKALKSHEPFNRTEAIETLVGAQLCANADLLLVQIENTTGFSLRSELLVATALATLGESPTTAGKQLDEALMLSEVPPSRHEGHTEFCLATAHALDYGHRDEAERLLNQAGLSPETFITWRLKVLNQLLQDNHTDAPAWWDQTWRYWAASANNLNFVSELPAAVKRMPLELVSSLASEIEQISSPAHKRLLAAAISARMKPGDPAANNLLGTALDNIDEPSPNGLAAWRILAFIAGQWWDKDQPKAERLWSDALLRLTNDPNLATDPTRRSVHLADMIEDVRLGAPQLALPVLLAWEKPLPVPGQFSFVVPGPGVPVPKAAGMRDRDYLLALALADEARQPGYARQQLSSIPSPMIRTLAASSAARLADQAPVEDRLAWCQIALEAAGQLEEHYLQCLFSSDAAEAFDAIGLKAKALEVAVSTGRDVIQRGDFFESVSRKPAYAHALGKCLRLVAASRDISASTELIWGARCLGTGLQTALGYLAPLMASLDAHALQGFQAAEHDGMSLFS